MLRLICYNGSRKEVCKREEFVMNLKKDFRLTERDGIEKESHGNLTDKEFTKNKTNKNKGGVVVT